MQLWYSYVIGLSRGLIRIVSSVRGLVGPVYSPDRDSPRWRPIPLDTKLTIDSLAVHGGYAPELGDGLSPDINLSSTFYLPGDGDQGPPAYGRENSPAFGALERALADVNGAD